jgi:hypothetical protein
MLRAKQGGMMATPDEHRYSKRVALWVLVVVAPLMILLELIKPRSWAGWHYFSLLVWGYGFASAAYRLVTEKGSGAETPDADSR